jgi:Fur family iron response transcriptional regulator
MQPISEAKTRMQHSATASISSDDIRRLVIKKLIDREITPTQQRVQIGAVLLPKHQHLSADQILTKVNHSAHHVSKATVYNTLALFVQKGLAKEVCVDSSKVFYDSNTGPHHHFYNVSTGSLVDIEMGEIALSGLPTPPLSAVIKDVNIVVRLEQQAPLVG